MNKNSRVCDKIPWNITRINRFETFLAHSLHTISFAREFLIPFGKTTLWEGKVLQIVSTILPEGVVVIDITTVIAAQTSSFNFTVQGSCKSVNSMICRSDE